MDRQHSAVLARDKNLLHPTPPNLSPASRDLNLLPLDRFLPFPSCGPLVPNGTIG